MYCFHYFFQHLLHPCLQVVKDIGVEEYKEFKIQRAIELEEEEKELEEIRLSKMLRL